VFQVSHKEDAMGKRQEPFLMKAIVHANVTEKRCLFVIRN